MGAYILSALRSADLILIITEVGQESKIQTIQKELFDANFRLDKKKPNIKIKKTGQGGINLELIPTMKEKEDLIKTILHAHKILNADVHIHENISMQDLIDAIHGNCHYVPSLTVINKADIGQAHKKPGQILISALKNKNLDLLKEAIYKKLGFIQVYLKPLKGQASDTPLILKKPLVREVCKKIHNTFLQDFRYARVWGKSVKYPGQHVGLDHKLKDGDHIQIIKKRSPG
jgi:hypothetical protein